MTVSVPAAAVLLNGSSGVGKSRTLLELGVLLGERNTSHALIDLDHLSLSWPRPSDDPWGGRIARDNLAAVAGNYRGSGIDRLAIAHVFTDWAHLNGCRAALGAASAGEIPVVRLRASRHVVEQRLRSRHATEAPWELDAFLAGYEGLTRALDDVGLDDHVIDVDTLSPREVAEQVADIAGW
ncbi:hypothetical protein ACFVTX_17620 [Agromyces sp. NPDC058136]|uniref:hypothetical protein n=1 Tax=Agromyces sp. NPDC058136 TaxID=3346354 RepID=UPI0036DEA906